MNYYPFHIGDYASATRHLTWEEDAAYRRLLDIYYTTEAPLPLELRAVYRLACAAAPSHREAIDVVLGEFFELTEEGYVHERCEAEISAMQVKQQRQRDKANKRWQKPETEPGNAPAMPRHDQKDAAASDSDADAVPPTPTPTPTPTRERERSPSGSRLPADWVMSTEFEHFCRQERPDLDPNVVACNFADYWHAESGAKARKVDWMAAWRGWVRREKRATPQSTGETVYQRSQRERVEQFAPTVAARAPGQPRPLTFIEEIQDVPAIASR